MKKIIIIGLMIVTLFGFIVVPIGLADLNGFEEWLEPPNIVIESPQNTTYTSIIPLNFTVKSPDSWQYTPVSFSYEVGNGLAQKLISVTYAVDGKIYESFPLNSNLSVPFNFFTNLSNLTVGEHKLTVWTNATGVTRNWISSEVTSVPISSIASTNFTITQQVDSSTPASTLLSTLLVAGIFAVIVIEVVILALLLYGRHRKTIKS